MSPVKLRPKMSSSGGRIFFGVVVFVIESWEGLILGSVAIASSCDCIL